MGGRGREIDLYYGGYFAIRTVFEVIAHLLSRVRDGYKFWKKIFSNG